MTMIQIARRLGRATTMRGGAAVALAQAGEAARRRARTVAMLARMAAAGVIGVAASPALSQDLSPISTMLTTIVTAMTGPIGVALATLAIIGVGLTCLFGRLNFGWFGAVVAGVVMIFSADTIVGGFGGGAP